MVPNKAANLFLDLLDIKKEKIKKIQVQVVYFKQGEKFEIPFVTSFGLKTDFHIYLAFLLFPR